MTHRPSMVAAGRWLAPLVVLLGWGGGAVGATGDGGDRWTTSPAPSFRLRDAGGGDRDPVTLGRPLAAALGHLDRDGVLDLAVTYASGALVVFRGDESFAESPARRDAWRLHGRPAPAAFRAEATVVDLPFAADLLAIGDFDADADEDVAVAAVGRRDVVLLANDGLSTLAVAETAALPGEATAWVAGDVNWQNGLTDLVVGVETAEGPALAIFEGTRGALRAAAEIVSVPARVEALALVRLDRRSVPAIAAAAGDEVLILHGRSGPAEVTTWAGLPRPLASERLRLPKRVTTLLIGDFAGDAHRQEIVAGAETGESWLIEADEGDRLTRRGLGAVGAGARLVVSSSAGRRHAVLVTVVGGRLVELGLDEERAIDELGTVTTVGAAAVPLAARLDGDALDDLVVVSEARPLPTAVVRAPTAIYTVNDSGDGADAVINNLCATATGGCTLRAALQEAAAHLGSTVKVSTVVGFSVIQPSTALPNAVGPVTVDGLQCSSAFICWLTRLDGSSAGGTASGLVASGTGATISSFRITGFSGKGAWLEGNGSHVLKGCEIGIVDGTTADPNTYGVWATSSNNVIGGTTVASRNIISGNSWDGILVENAAPPTVGNQVLGNYIGTNSAGTAAVGNRSGVVARDPMSIGSAQAGNVISGNDEYGVNAFDTSEVLVRNNYVGTNAAGTAAVANLLAGVYFDTVDLGWIGGATGSGNVISGNHGSGIEMVAGVAAYDVIESNRIGTDAGGTASLENWQEGIRVRGGAPPAIIGEAGAANLISGNRLDGVRLENYGSSLNANLIGLDAAGVAAVPNGGAGIFITSIGAMYSQIEGNEIAFNPGGGVVLESSGTWNQIRRNSIHDHPVGLGIDLRAAADPPSGVTPNDPLDADSGPNGLQNFPVVTAARASATEVLIAGTLDSKTSSTYVIELFAGGSCHASGYGEGEAYLGSVQVTTDAEGHASFEFGTFSAIGVGTPVTATATHVPSGDGTSEFSACRTTTTLPLALFANGFESGSIAAWSAHRP